MLITERLCQLKVFVSLLLSWTNIRECMIVWCSRYLLTCSTHLNKMILKQNSMHMAKK